MRVAQLVLPRYYVRAPVYMLAIMLGLTRPAQGNPQHVVGEVFGHRCADEAGVHRVHPDVVLPEFKGR